MDPFDTFVCEAPIAIAKFLLYPIYCPELFITFCSSILGSSYQALSTRPKHLYVPFHCKDCIVSLFLLCQDNTTVPRINVKIALSKSGNCLLLSVKILCYILYFFLCMTFGLQRSKSLTERRWEINVYIHYVQRESPFILTAILPRISSDYFVFSVFSLDKFTNWQYIVIEINDDFLPLCLGF